MWLHGLRRAEEMAAQHREHDERRLCVLLACDSVPAHPGPCCAFCLTQEKWGE